MSDQPDNQAAETEKGFGTGLRAQLQRRQEEGDVQEPATTNVELRLELTARPASDGESTVVNADLAATKSELEAAQRREASLRLELDTPEWREGLLMRSLESLPVSF